VWQPCSPDLTGSTLRFDKLQGIIKFKMPRTNSFSKDSVCVKGSARLGCLGRGLGGPLCRLSGANPYPFQT
jgi:hypothetical protein